MGKVSGSNSGRAGVGQCLYLSLPFSSFHYLTGRGGGRFQPPGGVYMETVASLWAISPLRTWLLTAFRTPDPRVPSILSATGGWHTGEQMRPG